MNGSRFEKLKANKESSQPQLEWMAIGKIQPNPNNPRVHSRKQINKIIASIDKFGFLNPVLIDEDNIALAGHGRLEAARIKGLTHVPVIRFAHLSAAQKKAYLITDNRLAELSAFDRGKLAVELTELIDLLPAEGLDVTITGFEPAEIDLLLADMSAPAATPEDNILALPEIPVARRGDLWALGKHHLICGDSRDPACVARLMGGVTAAVVVTDPPYNRRASDIGGRGKTQHGNFAFASGEMSTSEFRQFLTETLGNAVKVSRPGAVHYVTMDWRHIGDLIAVGEILYGTMLNLICWNKTNAGQGSFYRSQHELIGVFRVGDHQHRNNVELGRYGRTRSNVWTYAGVNSFGRNRDQALASHPTVKPVALVADALLDCTLRGETVLDPFMGSGTTIIAAEKVGRVTRGVEYEPGYIDVAIRRWQAFTKLEATLVDDGRSFDEILRERSGENRHD